MIEALDVVVDGHQRHLVPLGAELTGDPRCTLTHGDFFEIAAHDPPMLEDSAPAQFDAILVDIDRSPRHLLDPSHGTTREAGYVSSPATCDPTASLSSGPTTHPTPTYVAVLESCFARADAHIVSFANFLTDATTHSTIYVASDPMR